MKKRRIKDLFRGRKSYFYRFLMSFMLTLFVPLLSILFIYLQAEQTIKNQILVSNERELRQFFRIVNSVTQEMRDTCLSTTFSKECSIYAYYSNYNPQKATYQILTVKDLLNNITKEEYSDIFVYFPTEDRIISGPNASLKSDYYYDTYYSAAGTDFRQEFDGVLECSSVRPTFFVMNSGSEKPYLCVAMKQLNYNEPELDFVAVVVLENDFISQLIGGESVNGGTIMMFDKKGELLIANDPDFAAWHLEGYNGQSSFYEVEVDQKDYMMMVMETEVMDGYYASVIPDDFFWKQLYRTRMMLASN